jgi:Asp-tRNA(Asn)/Glu-tRNA(Gln) amidotransferase A subunit family amidase
MTDACDLTAVEARRRIGARDLAPSELLESCIARIEAIDPAINALPARDFERARIAARAADEIVARGEALGPLHGLPFGVKDLEETAGLVTTFGSELYRGHVPARDADPVARLKRAGGIVLGKTNTPEFGAGANTRNRVYGATGNPFDPSRSAAGSSGGSAAALATGMVPLATGSDTGGSLRNPAAFCGVVGFRPTPGLVASERSLRGWSPLGVLGPMARTVADVRLMLSVMASDSGADPLATTIHGRVVRAPADFAASPPVDLSSLRAAFTPDFGFAPTEAAIRAVFGRLTARLAPLFGRAEAASPDCAGTDEAFEVLRAVGFLAGHHDRVMKTPDQVGPNVRANVEEGLGYTALDVARAETAQTAIYRRWQAFFEHWDVIITPAITLSPRPWSELYPAQIDGRPTRSYFHWLALAYAVSLVGHPAISLPVGRDAAGLPFGLQIVGPRGGDARVLAVAEALETALAGDPLTARPTPDLAALADAPPIREAPGFLGFG